MAIWRIETTGHTKFPYRILIVEGHEETLSLVAQEKWPGQKGNIFCLRGHEDIEDHGEVIEECAVVSLRRYGRKLSILLDRANKKRCEFFISRKTV